MVSFRFFIVTVTAIFLALALGITVGATVVDRATVESLQSGVDNVNRRADAAEQRNKELEDDLRRWDEFGDQAESAIVAGRLAGQPVVVVANRGTDPKTVTDVVNVLVESGTLPEGVVWLEEKITSPDPKNEADLDQANQGEANISTTSAVTTTTVPVATLNDYQLLDTEIAFRNQFVEGLRSTAPLATAFGSYTKLGFVKIDEPPSVAGAQAITAERKGVPSVVYVSDAGSDIRNDQLPLAIVQSLADTQRVPVIAAESIRADVVTATGAISSENGDWISEIRSSDRLKATVSSVDDLESLRGRVALVGALAERIGGTVGHYGIASGASRQYPERPA